MNPASCYACGLNDYIIEDHFGIEANLKAQPSAASVDAHAVESFEFSADEPPAPKGREDCLIKKAPKKVDLNIDIVSNVLKYGSYLSYADQIPAFVTYFAKNYAHQLPGFAIYFVPYVNPVNLKIVGQTIQTVQYCVQIKEIVQNGAPNPIQLTNIIKVINTATTNYSRINNIQDIFKKLSYKDLNPSFETGRKALGYIGNGILVAAYFIDRTR